MQLVSIFDIPNAFCGETVPFEDHRGSLSRIYNDCSTYPGEWSGHISQINYTTTTLPNTFRGFHFQPKQWKVVRCLSGHILDYCLDLRKDSPTYKQFAIVNLKDSNVFVVIPPGCAHGVFSVTANTMLYVSSEAWDPKTEGGVRHDDPMFNPRLFSIKLVTSERDRSFPDWTD
jgi:dTDP-4-dehydrorhamnose 3,5-epimerase